MPKVLVPLAVSVTVTVPVPEIDAVIVRSFDGVLLNEVVPEISLVRVCDIDPFDIVIVIEMVWVGVGDTVSVWTIDVVLD